MNVVTFDYDFTYTPAAPFVEIEVDLYLAAIQLGSELIHGLHVVSIPSTSEAVVGRDMLNQLVVTLNGLAGVTEVHIE